MKKTIDILGLGYTAVDDLLYFDTYPKADAKLPVRRRERHCGGLAATALVAAARMGCRCAYAGTLGDDEHSRFVVKRFGDEGIDVTNLRRRLDARPVRSTILVDQVRHTRTVLFDTNGVVGADSDWPQEDVIRAAGVLLIDTCGVEGMIRAARIAREAQIPVVADFEHSEDPLFPLLLAVADHLILSRSFRLEGDQPAGFGPGRPVALGVRPACGGRHLRQRGLLVCERPAAGDCTSPTGVARQRRRHHRLRRRFSRRLCRGLAAWANRAGGRAVRHGRCRRQGRALRRSGGNSHACGCRRTNGTGISTKQNREAR